MLRVQCEQGRTGMSVKGKTAVITGSNSGIGLGIAWELARAGVEVVLNSFTDSDEDHAQAKEIADETGTKARYSEADMSDGDQGRALIEKAGGGDISARHWSPSDMSAWM